MIIWIDAQLSPAIAEWIKERFSVESVPIRDLGLREATDREIFAAAKKANAILMTKDSDFAQLLDRYGPPPQVIWITCGNTSYDETDGGRRIMPDFIRHTLSLNIIQPEFC